MPQLVRKISVGGWGMWGLNGLLVCRFFTVGDFGFGSLERIMEALASMDQPQERPTEQSFLEQLPRLLVKRRSQVDPAQTEEGEPMELPGDDSFHSSEPVSEHATVGEPCTICHDAYEYGHEVVELPCNHSFHEGCIMMWLKAHHTCPVSLPLPYGTE